jgi:hypothetical protein
LSSNVACVCLVPCKVKRWDVHLPYRPLGTSASRPAGTATGHAFVRDEFPEWDRTDQRGRKRLRS